MKCEYCKGEIPYNTNQCPSCGAPCEFIPEPKSASASEPDKEEKTSSVKQFPSVNVDFLNETMTEEELVENEFADMDEEEDNDYKIAKIGACIFVVILVIAIIAVVFFFKSK